MPIITVAYPKTASSRFDHSYYMERHIPRVQSLLTGFGLQRIDLFRGVAGLTGGPPTFELIGNLVFADISTIGPALEAHAAEIMADIPNFTDVQPEMQMSEDVSS